MSKYVDPIIEVLKTKESEIICTSLDLSKGENTCTQSGQETKNLGF